MHVAEFNWAYLRAPWGDPKVARFVNATDTVNGVAGRTDGFVWRDPFDDETRLEVLHDLVQQTDGPFDPDCLTATLSVWESVETLRAFVFDTLHGRFWKRRDDWFIAQGVPVYVLWPVAEGHRPGLEEAKAKMQKLTAEGPSPEAYDFAWLEREAA